MTLLAYSMYLTRAEHAAMALYLNREKSIDHNVGLLGKNNSLLHHRRIDVRAFTGAVVLNHLYSSRVVEEAAFYADDLHTRAVAVQQSLENLRPLLTALRQNDLCGVNDSESHLQEGIGAVIDELNQRK